MAQFYIQGHAITGVQFYIHAITGVQFYRQRHNSIYRLCKRASQFRGTQSFACVYIHVYYVCVLRGRHIYIYIYNAYCVDTCIYNIYIYTHTYMLLYVYTGRSSNLLIYTVGLCDIQKGPAAQLSRHTSAQTWSVVHEKRHSEKNSTWGIAVQDTPSRYHMAANTKHNNNQETTHNLKNR